MAVPPNQARYHVDLLAFVVQVAVLVTGRDGRVVGLKHHESRAVAIDMFRLQWLLATYFPEKASQRGGIPVDVVFGQSSV